MGAREILTLQFGHYSNYVGTHWWNIQEAGFDYQQVDPELNHDVLFREGLTLQGDVTFTPRLLLVDLKGSLKALPEDGELYSINQDREQAETAVQWHTDVVKMQLEKPEEKIAFQKDLVKPGVSGIKNDDISKDVRVWSDFLQPRFHPRTVNVVKEYQHNNEATPFDIFPLGSNLWKSHSFQEEFSDKIRNYIEECDYFQGFHVLLDSDDAFSGLSTLCIEHLRDEYTSKSIIAFPIIQPQIPYHSFENDADKYKAAKKHCVGLLNLIFCIDTLREHTSLFIPLSTGDKGFKYQSSNRSFYHVNYQPNLPYHSSAILASALDTFTLRYRLKSSQYLIADLCADLNLYGRKAAAASLCLPFSLNKDQDLIDCLDNWDGPLSRSITPNCEIGSDKLMQVFTLRGIPESRLKRPVHQATKQKDMPAYKCTSIKEMLSYYVACTSYASATDVTVVDKPLPVRTPYPKIFGPHVNNVGNIDTLLKGAPDVNSVPVLAGLHNGECVGNMLEHLLKDVKTINFKNFHQYQVGGVECDEFDECVNRTLSLRECYEDNYEL